MRYQYNVTPWPSPPSPQSQDWPRLASLWTLEIRLSQWSQWSHSVDYEQYAEHHSGQTTHIILLTRLKLEGWSLVQREIILIFFCYLFLHNQGSYLESNKFKHFISTHCSVLMKYFQLVEVCKRPRHIFVCLIWPCAGLSPGCHVCLESPVTGQAGWTCNYFLFIMLLLPAQHVHQNNTGKHTGVCIEIITWPWQISKVFSHDIYTCKL